MLDVAEYEQHLPQNGMYQTLNYVALTCFFGRGKLGIWLRMFSRNKTFLSHLPGHSGRSHTSPSYCGEFKVHHSGLGGVVSQKGSKASKLVVLLEAVKHKTCYFDTEAFRPK